MSLDHISIGLGVSCIREEDATPVGSQNMVMMVGFCPCTYPLSSPVPTKGGLPLHHENKNPQSHFLSGLCCCVPVDSGTVGWILVQNSHIVMVVGS